MPMKSLRN